MPTSTVKHVSGPIKPYSLQSKASSPVTSVKPFLKAKILRLTWRATVLVTGGLFLLTGPDNVKAQGLRARIVVTSLEPASIRVDVELPGATSVLSFRNTYGGVLGLGERIEKVATSSAGGEAIPARKLAPGEFQTVEDFTRVSYAVSLAEPSRPVQMSHVSWLNRDQGLLMLADLLPQSAKSSGNSSAQIQLDIPPGWTVASNVKKEGIGRYSTDDLDKAVFLIGSSLRAKSQKIGSTSVSIVTSSQWPFSDADVLKIAGKIIEGYSKLTGAALKRDSVLMLIPFPGEGGPERWSAETRDNNVVLLLGRQAKRNKVLTKLGIVLSHELFHLWVPNSLKLEGDYDWFFEGFTLYQALRMDRRLGLISFSDYLDTIARVYDSYLSSMDHNRLSLIEASERRWTTSSSLVYDKGMLVAFIYDLNIRNHTDCKSSLDDIYRELFRLSSTGQASANGTIIKLLSQGAGMESFPKDYVEGAGEINLESVLVAYGFQVQPGIQGLKATKIIVSRDLNKLQRKLLGCLGH
jgi:predicted metalloprotease with PDZ domain